MAACTTSSGGLVVVHKEVSGAELLAHQTETDCWLVLYGWVYDFTHFVNTHPGGKAVLLRFAGADGTVGFAAVHNRDMLDEDQLPADVRLVGKFCSKPGDEVVARGPASDTGRPGVAASEALRSNSSSAGQQDIMTSRDVDHDEADIPAATAPGKPLPRQPAPRTTEVSQPAVVSSRSRKQKSKPRLSQILNIYDMEMVAASNVSAEAWAYLVSAGDDEVSYRENSKAFQRVFLRPRILRNVRDISLRVPGTCFDAKSTHHLPFYVSATALGKLYHPDGEVAITRAAGKMGMTQMCPTLASCSMQEMADARAASMTQWWQLYVNPDRRVTEKVVLKAEKLGFQALIITVDAPQLGRRERDMRHKAPLFANLQEEEGQTTKGNTEQGTGRALSAWLDPSFDWEGLRWLQGKTRLPIVLKGIQTGEDAVLAYRSGVAGIIVSNHGGRQLDYCRSGLECLEEVVTSLRAECGWVSPREACAEAGRGRHDQEKTSASARQFDVLVDGGVRRGGDVFKALALGAKMVGLGRPFIYGLAAYGEEGVKRVIQLLIDELTMVMRLIGCASIADIRPEMALTNALTFHGQTLNNQLDFNYTPPWQVLESRQPSANKSKL
ncbi:unnamed protein product [Amoebophrya sp. A120]|nr:unnamed protein product [Amoebophrya sp. A120]|eukprot:GSA120T00018032001.1